MIYQENDIIPFEEIKQAADWVNAQGNYWLEDYQLDSQGRMQLIVKKQPDPTPEEIAEKELEQAKAKRASSVSKIVVEVDGMKFDGDEIAQTRMGRTISAAMALGVDLNTEKRAWVLADNTVAEPTIAQLAKALELASNEQTRLWTVPYQSNSEEDTVAISSIGIE